MLVVSPNEVIVKRLLGGQAFFLPQADGRASLVSTNIVVSG
jgi:hypothetical protein